MRLLKTAPRLLPVLAVFGLLTLTHAATAENLLLNGDFALSDGHGGAAGWSPFVVPGLKTGSATVVTPGYRTRQALVLAETMTPSLFGLFSQPVDVTALPGEELLLTCYYRTEGDPGAQVALVGFSGSFLPKEWGSPYLQSESQAIPAARDWSLMTWHFRYLPGVRDLVTVFRLGARGKLFLSRVALSTYPTEVGVDLVQAGTVDSPPGRRLLELELHNRGSRDKNLQVSAIAYSPDRGPVQVAAPAHLAAGQTQSVRLNYAYDYRYAHSLRCIVQDTDTAEVYDQRDVQVPGADLGKGSLAPAFRDTLLEKVPTPRLIVAGAENVAPSLRGQLQISAELIGAGAGEDFHSAPAPEGEYRLEFETPSLISGEHVVRVTARLGKNEQVIDLMLHRPTSGQTQVAFDDHLRLWSNGTVMLPRGVYGVTSPEEVQAAAAAGFNFVVVPSGRASYEVQAAADKADLAVIVSGASINADLWQHFLDKWGNVSQTLGWLPYSRPDLRNLPPAAVQTLYEDLAKLSPTLPVIETLASPSKARDYTGAADILIAWSLPVPDSPLRALGEMVDVLRADTNGAKPVWGLVQAAGVGHYEDASPGPDKPGRLPTAAEMSALAYLALLHGAKGLAWYSLDIPGYAGSRDYHLADDAPELWAALPLLNMHLRWLTPVILDGSWEALSPQGPLEMARWRYRGQEYVIAVNTSERGAITPLTGFAPGTAVEVMFEDRSLEADKDGTIQDSFAPFGVHVFVSG